VSRLRRLVVLLLMLALPVHGAIASSRWLCVGSPHAVAPTAAVHDHALHAHAMHDGDQAGSTHASHGKTSIDGAAPQGAVDATASADAGACQLCAACCLTAAAPPAPLATPSASAAEAGFPAIAIPVPRIVADTLERPPRAA